MFWNLNLMGESPIDSMLDKENITLEEILNEDDVLQECTARNKKLVEFLVRSEHIEELVNLITLEPSDNLEEKSRYKLANVSCEILTCNVPQINDKIAHDETLLNKLYTFLQSDNAKNPLLFSFFSRTLAGLLCNKSEQILEFLKSQNDFISLALQHIDVMAMMDLVMKLVQVVSTAEVAAVRQDYMQWLRTEGLVEKLVAALESGQDEDKEYRYCNVGQTLCNIIRFGREQDPDVECESSNPQVIHSLLDEIQSAETVTKLLDSMFSGKMCESALLSGFGVLEQLLEQSPRAALSDDVGSAELGEVTTSVDTVLTAIVPHLTALHRILVEPPSRSAVLTTAGRIEQPLGFARLNAARFVHSLLAFNHTAINTELSKNGTLAVLLDLFIQYEWNNFLHSQVVSCIASIVQSAPKDGTLLTHLLNDCGLVQRILSSFDTSTNGTTDGDGRPIAFTRVGYMGHLIQIANLINDNTTTAESSDDQSEPPSGAPDRH